MLRGWLVCTTFVLRITNADLALAENREIVCNRATPWGTCNNSCIQTRVCHWDEHEMEDCSQDNKTESRVQHRLCAGCAVGEWGNWKAWSACSATCGSGERTRRRFCDNPAPKNGGRACVGAAIETEPCSLDSCPIDCVWSDWGDWGKCSASCGGGHRLRTRTPTKTPAQHGGAACQGPETDRQDCNTEPCAEECKWNPWEPWGNCSTLCGHGTRTRIRTPVATVSSKCQAEKGEERCYTVCPGWSPWSQWSPCSESCGTGVRQSHRMCNNPLPPVDSGLYCEGSATKSEPCRGPLPRVDGSWSAWSDWGLCISGVRTRIRLCNRPPETCGEDCRGLREESKTCSVCPCLVEVALKPGNTKAIRLFQPYLFKCVYRGLGHENVSISFNTIPETLDTFQHSLVRGDCIAKREVTILNLTTEDSTVRCKVIDQNREDIAVALFKIQTYNATQSLNAERERLHRLRSEVPRRSQILMARKRRNQPDFQRNKNGLSKTHPFAKRNHNARAVRHPKLV